MGCYQIIEDTAVISKNTWFEAGLTENQFKKDSSKGFLKIYRRGTNGNTLIALNSIQLPDRISALENHLGSKIDSLDSKVDKMAEAIEKLTVQLSVMAATNAQLMTMISTGSVVPAVVEKVNKKPSVFPTPTIDIDARSWFLLHRKPSGLPVDPELITRYVNRCSILNAINEGLIEHKEARAKHGKKPNMGEFWELAKEFYMEQAVVFPCDPI